MFYIHRSITDSDLELFTHRNRLIISCTLFKSLGYSTVNFEVRLIIYLQQTTTNKATKSTTMFDSNINNICATSKYFI